MCSVAPTSKTISLGPTGFSSFGPSLNTVNGQFHKQQSPHMHNFNDFNADSRRNPYDFDSNKSLRASGQASNSIRHMFNS